MKTHTLTLTEEELELLLEALNSHEYWQLSDEQYRSSGYVLEPGSDDEEAAGEILRVGELQQKLEDVKRARRDLRKKALVARRKG